jgi:hypothetical protein
MKRKVALLLVLAMIISLLPVNLFANDAPSVVTPPLGTVWTGLHRVSTPANEPVTAHVNLDMRNFQTRLQQLHLGSTPTWSSAGALFFNVSLTGAGSDYLRFPANSEIMWPWNGSPASLMPSEYQPGNTWPLRIDAADLNVGGVPIPVADREWSAWFTRTGYQTGIVTVYHTGDMLPASIVGTLRIDMPLARVRANNTQMTAFFPGGGILAHGNLLGIAATGINVTQYPTDPVGFEWVANLNRLIISENSVSEFTRHLGPNRDFAVRLTAPAGYFWTSTPNNAVSGRGFTRSLTDNAYNTLFFAGEVNGVGGDSFIGITDETPVLMPRVRTPQNILAFDGVARYTYAAPGNRQELLVIIENLRRNPGPVGNAAGRIYIEGLQLVPGENAPRLGNVNIDVHVGTVSTVRTHRVPPSADRAGRSADHYYCHAGFSWGANTGGTNWLVRWTHEVPWRSDRVFNRITDTTPALLAAGWSQGNINANQTGNALNSISWHVDPPTALTHAEVMAQALRSQTQCQSVIPANWEMGWIPAILGGNIGPDAFVSTPIYVPGGPGQWEGGPGPATPDAPSPAPLGTPPGLGAGGNACTGAVVTGPDARVWRLDWYNLLTENLHVATRLTAALSLHVHGDLPYLRSGSVDEEYAQDYVTGTTARLQVRENVPSALGLGIGAPITFTFPEGIEIMSFRYRMYPTGSANGGWGWRPGNDYKTTNWIIPNADGTPLVTGTGGELTRFSADGQSVTLNRSIPHVANPRARTLEVEFRLAVEGGYEWKTGNTIDVTVSGLAVEANLAGADATIAVANVFDPVLVDFPELPITVPHVFLEQNIDHEAIGDIVITETAGNRLAINDEIWIYVQRTYIQRPWDIILTNNGGVIHDDSGLTVRVEQFNVTEVPGLTTQFHGLRLVVTGTSGLDTPGTVTLANNRVFGHVYPGEEYHIVVTGPAIARNHILVSAVESGVSFASGAPSPATQLQNRRGVFSSMPYYEELIDASEQITGEEPGFDRPSLAGVTIREGVAIGPVASPLYFESVPGTSLVAGYVSARAFAIISGFENIHWNNVSRIATLSGYDANGLWTVIQLSPNSYEATVTRGGTTTHPDIAFVAGDSGPVGTIAPIHRNDRLYLPLRFMFNILGFDQYYEITGGPSVRSVTFVAR